MHPKPTPVENTQKRKFPSMSNTRYSLTNEETQIFEKLKKQCSGHKLSICNSTTFPWYSWKEWQLVYKLIIKKKYNEACQRMDIWRRKSSIALPHPVDVTYNLLSIESNNEREASLALSMTIVRMIDGFSQLSTNKEDQRYAVSISVKMKSMEVPHVLTQARHSSSHGELLSFSKLKKLKVIALEFLVDTYWKPQNNLVQMYQYQILELLTEGDDFGTFLSTSMDEVIEIIVENVFLHYDPQNNKFIFEKFKGHGMIPSTLKILKSYLNQSVINGQKRDNLEKWVEIFSKKKYNENLNQVYIPNQIFNGNFMLDQESCMENIIE